jgi:hypothetical protein
MGVKFGSAARKSGFEEGFDVVELKVPSGRASPHWFYLPGLTLIVLVWVAQGRRSAQPRSAFGAPPQGGAAGGRAEPDSRRPLG